MAGRLGLFDDVPPETLATVTRMIDAGVQVPRARGMGRWFDAVGALVLGLPRASFEGHVPIVFEGVAGDPARVEGYPIGRPDDLALHEALGELPGAPAEIDPRPMVRAVLADVMQGRDPAIIAARFHRTIIDATGDLVERTLATTGIRRVVLTGGSFQNRLLERGLVERLGADRVTIAREVPVNDGGLALGQAWAAALALANPDV